MELQKAGCIYANDVLNHVEVVDKEDAAKAILTMVSMTELAVIQTRNFGRAMGDGYVVAMVFGARCARKGLL